MFKKQINKSVFDEESLKILYNYFQEKNAFFFFLIYHLNIQFTFIHYKKPFKYFLYF